MVMLRRGAYELGAKTYVVNYVKELKGLLGWCNSSGGTIDVALTHEGEKLRKDFVEQTFLHEVVHSIFNEIGRDNLSTDERLVQQFSLLLHQMLKTRREGLIGKTMKRVFYR